MYLMMQHDMFSNFGYLVRVKKKVNLKELIGK